MISPTLILSLLATTYAYTPSSGCGKPLPEGTTTGTTGVSNTISLTSNGRTRSFLLHIPSNYSPTSARGLIFSYHGRGGSSASQEKLSSFSDPFFNPNMLAVYPQGVANQWQGDPAASTDDVRFTLDMMDHVAARYCVDTDAVYATGKSNGGGFSANVLACDKTAAARIAAFASASGAYYQDLVNGNCNAELVPITCSPGRVVPLLEFHGTDDGTIDYDGGERRGKCLPSMSHFMMNWAYIDGFATSNVTTQLYNGKVQKYDFGGKTNFLTHYRVERLTHAWPATIANSDSGTPTYFNATSIMMDFFQAHPLK